MAHHAHKALIFRLICSLRLSVRTPPFHGGESGSIPLGSAIIRALDDAAKSAAPHEPPCPSPPTNVQMEPDEGPWRSTSLPRTIRPGLSRRRRRHGSTVRRPTRRNGAPECWSTWHAPDRYPGPPLP